MVGGVRISKASKRLESYGTVDELNSYLGMLATHIAGSKDEASVVRVQNALFRVATHLATDQSQTPLYPSANLPEEEIGWLEREIDRLLAMLPEKQGFVLPGGCVAASVAHVARTVCRRAERCVVALAEEAEVGSEVRQYLNRLSDYLFVLAKKINFEAGVSEKVWKSK